MQQILILGGGFAGLWSAAGAARLLDQRGIAPDRIRVTLVNRDDWHSIRVRNYERDLADLRIPLAKVLEPIGVDRVVGTVTRDRCRQPAGRLRGGGRPPGAGL